MHARHIAIWLMSILATGLTLGHGVVSGREVTVEFHGTVDSIPGSLGTVLRDGGEATGRFTFDDNSDQFLESITEFTIVADGHTFRATGLGDLAVEHNSQAQIREYFAVSFAESQPVGNMTPALMALQIQADDSIPFAEFPLPPELSTVNSAIWTVDFTNLARLSGSVDSIIVSSVPEPTTVCLLLMPWVAAISCRKRRGCST
ncbi:MAG: hypothetical protein KDA60_16745 [Planctomycetales bacterium]|nr:hypothetical protein [Planctomycetales bacterium]